MKIFPAQRDADHTKLNTIEKFRQAIKDSAKFVQPEDKRQGITNERVASFDKCVLELIGKRDAAALKKSLQDYIDYIASLLSRNLISAGFAKDLKIEKIDSEQELHAFALQVFNEASQQERIRLSGFRSKIPTGCVTPRTRARTPNNEIQEHPNEQATNTEGTLKPEKVKAAGVKPKPIWKP